MKINLTNRKPRKIFTITLLLEFRSKCDWYQYGEKSTKHFLNLRKQKAVNGAIKKIIQNDIEITAN